MVRGDKTRGTNTSEEQRERLKLPKKYNGETIELVQACNEKRSKRHTRESACQRAMKIRPTGLSEG